MHAFYAGLNEPLGLNCLKSNLTNQETFLQSWVFSASLPTPTNQIFRAMYFHLFSMMANYSKQVLSLDNATKH